MLFTIVSSNPTTNGNFLHKFVSESGNSVATPLGNVTSTKACTRYIFTDKQAKPNTTVDLDLDKFSVREKPFAIPGGEVVTLKYLVPR